MAKYSLTNSAKDDLINIYQYGVAKFGESQALNYFNDLYDSFDQIAQRPFAYEAVDHIKQGYRRAVSGSDAIYFYLEEDHIIIAAIIGRQDIFKRL